MNKGMKIQSHLIFCIMKYGKIHDFTLDIPQNTQALSTFHNWIKFQLISFGVNYTNGESLLDIAVGRAGDLIKWTRTGIKYVTGIDSDESAIFGKISTVGFDGAIARYQGFKGKKPKVSFHKMSATDKDILIKLNKKDSGKIYDIVSCQFAFHYFVKEIDVVLGLISQKLKSGGLFIGTASDGDLIRQNLINGDINLPIVKIQKKNNNEYIYNLNSEQPGRVTFFQYKGATTEYFLYKEFLVYKAKEYGLELVEILNFSSWYNKYDKRLSYQEQIASFFNFSFVFIKS